MLAVAEEVNFASEGSLELGFFFSLFYGLVWFQLYKASDNVPYGIRIAVVFTVRIVVGSSITVDVGISIFIAPNRKLQIGINSREANTGMRRVTYLPGV